ncbi:MAG: dihydropteroate synthase [Acidobacteria bacterium]|nr:dihydropteroate synthase [Acidobacteriota bacterium]
MAARQRFTWQLKARSLELGERTILMGVLNVTPDSFSNHGQHFDHHKAIEHGLHLLECGADIVDIGGESTRPGTAAGTSEALPENEELRRILPALEGIKKARPDALISIDTYKSTVAKAALEAGAHIINDVSGGAWDPAMYAAAAELGCGFVLTHTRGQPAEWKKLKPEPEIVKLVVRELEERLQLALEAGVGRERIVLDPGFGFGKGWEENYRMLAGFDEFGRLGFPLLAGTSRKKFIGKTLERVNTAGEREEAPPRQRLYGTLASAVACILKGAHIVRVHNARAMRDAALVADEILRAAEPAGRHGGTEE